MNNCIFNTTNANIQLIEVMEATYKNLDLEQTFPVEEKFDIFKLFFEGLETGLNVGSTNSGVTEYEVPPILVKIRFIITEPSLNIETIWKLLGSQIK